MIKLLKNLFSGTADAKKDADNGDAEWQKRLIDLLSPIAEYPKNRADSDLQGIEIAS